jgi:uncharacterized protein (DUF1330 family)
MAFTIEPIRMQARTRGALPRAYAVRNEAGDTVAIVRKTGGQWMLRGKKMHKFFPSRIHARGTNHRPFPTVAALRQWVASPEAQEYLKAEHPTALKERTS